MLATLLHHVQVDKACKLVTFNLYIENKQLKQNWYSAFYVKDNSPWAMTCKIVLVQ